MKCLGDNFKGAYLSGVNMSKKNKDGLEAGSFVSFEDVKRLEREAKEKEKQPKAKAEQGKKKAKKGAE